MSRRRFSAEDWLDLAISALAKDGPDALKLDAICARAGLTKGSFYHHFDDHNAFLRAIIDLWRKRQTDDVIAETSTHEDPEAVIDALLEHALKIDYQLELGIRELARKDPEIARTVREIDDVRVTFMAQIYAKRFNRPPEEVRDAAYLEYSAFSGFMLLDPMMPEDRQRHLADLYDRIVVTHFERDA